MLFNNIKMLTKKRAAKDVETDYTILRALTGLHCSVCDAPLSSKDRRLPGNPTQLYSDYTCCQQAHCPYCGASPKEKCAHLFASRSSGDWRIVGLPDVADRSLPEPPSVSAENLLDYSEAQKQAAWGEAYPLLATQYGPGWRCLNKKSISGSDLVQDIARPENRQDIVSNQFYFTPDTEKCAVRIQQSLTKDVASGFHQMISEPPEGNEFVHRILSFGTMPPADSSTDSFVQSSLESLVSSVAFSPCGNYFAVLHFRRGELWETNTPRTEALVRFKISRSPNNSFVNYCAVKFSPDGRFISARCATGTIDRNTEESFTEIRSAHDGALHRTILDRGDVAFETGSFIGDEQAIFDGFLHGGATYLTVRSRCIRLYNLSGDNSSNGPVLTLTLRLPVSHLAIAPDGETFITTAGLYAVVWRVPATELPR